MGLMRGAPTSADEVVWDFENGNDHEFILWSVKKATPAPDAPDVAGDEAITGGWEPGNPNNLPEAGVAWTIGPPTMFDGLLPGVGDHARVDGNGRLLYSAGTSRMSADHGFLNTYNLNLHGDYCHTQENDQIASSPIVQLHEGSELTATVAGGGAGQAPVLDIPGQGYTDGSGGVAVLSAENGTLLASMGTPGHGGEKPYTLDLSTFANQKVIIEVVDAFEGGWGWIAVDEIVITNAVALPRTPPGGARAPRPDDEATDVSRDIILSWTPGNFADAHDVYFSTDFDNVIDGVALVSPHQDANVYDPGRLEYGQTYYWRVDEVNAPPDSTVYEGSVWSFTIEPLAYPISSASITVTASSSVADQGPEKTIDRSGMDVNDLHSDDIADMWLSDVSETNSAWIQYEFDKPYKLHQMLIWNYNGVGLNALPGCKDVMVQYSLDGTNWIQVDTVSEFAQAPGTSGYAHSTIIDFDDIAVQYVHIDINSNWSNGFINQYGLSEVQFLHIPVSAREPNPESGATDVPVDSTLSWKAGREAAAHDVYLSTDEQAVKDGIITSIRVTDANYSPDLDLESTYYWRVDEVNEAEIPAISQGDIWSFATADHIVVDNFESYNGLNLDDPQSNRIFIIWNDGVGYGTQDNPPYSAGNGTGSIIGYEEVPFVERQIAHDGKQSMPYYYNNSGSTGKTHYSEAEANVSDFRIGSDWTKGRADVLSLYFYGTQENNANASDRIYVALKDRLGHLASVSYAGEPSEMKEAWWHKWVIELKEFENAGVDLTNITTVYLGVGNRVAPQAGGSGVLFFDDIRLLLSRPAPSLPEPEPINQVPVAHWPLDEGAGTIVGDSAGGRTGTVMGGVGTIWVAGKKGAHALHFNGEDNHYVDCGTFNPAAGTSKLTCAVWAKWDGSTSNWQGLVCKRDTWAANGMMWQIELNQDTDLLGVFMRDGGRLYTSEPLLISEWQHVAFTIDNANNSVLYIDGQAVATSTTFQLGSGTNAHVLIGATFYQNATGQDCFNGTLDDIYLFNDALTQGQIITLMDP